MARGQPEIERQGTALVFHHLYDTGSPGRKNVRTAFLRFAQATAPKSLRQVSNVGAWELGAVAAMEDERLFETGN